MKRILLPLLVFLVLNTQATAGTQCFIVKENGHTLAQAGQCGKRHAPCSTFKIAISLMGYNEGILTDTTHPEWPYEKGYPDFLESWKHPQNPTTWIKNSCVWYSQLITTKLGMSKFKGYVKKFDYGNKDVSGDKGKNNGLTHAWLSSSLQISGYEQVNFLQKLIDDSLPVSKNASRYTQDILFVETLPNGWKLYGKTGSGQELQKDSSHNASRQIGWFVGWLEKGNRKIIFAHFIEDEAPIASPAGPRSRDIAKEKLEKLIGDKS